MKHRVERRSGRGCASKDGARTKRSSRGDGATAFGRGSLLESLGEPMPFRALAGTEATRDLYGAAHAGVGRQVRVALGVIEDMVARGDTIVLAISSAVSVSDFVRATVTPLLRRGLVSVVTTTGANVYHDVQRVVDPCFWKIPQDAFPDAALREAGLIRVYDIVFREQALLDTDAFFSDILLEKDMQRPMTTTELHDAVGRRVAAIEDSRGTPEEERSLVSTCHRLGVPLFCGAPYDASAMLNSAKLRLDAGDDRYRFRIDGELDIIEFAAYHYLAQTTGLRNISVIILGGGVPKNYSLQPEPFLGQILYLKAPGGEDLASYRRDVQVCDANVDNTGLSSCPAGEAHTWGKTSLDCVVSGSQYVHADMMVGWPPIASALIGAGAGRKPPRLLARRDEAIRRLRAAAEPGKAWRLAHTTRSALLPRDRPRVV